MSHTAEAIFVLTNKKGLHARAAAKFVKTAAAFDAKIAVAKIAGSGITGPSDVTEASGNSILGLMMLGAECGASIRLRISGNQADVCLQALGKLLQERFGEE